MIYENVLGHITLLEKFEEFLVGDLSVSQCSQIRTCLRLASMLLGFQEEKMGRLTFHRFTARASSVVFSLASSGAERVSLISFILLS